jgi:hypothetical protein
MLLTRKSVLLWLLGIALSIYSTVQAGSHGTNPRRDEKTLDILGKQYTFNEAIPKTLEMLRSGDPKLQLEAMRVLTKFERLGKSLRGLQGHDLVAEIERICNQSTKGDPTELEVYSVGVLTSINDPRSRRLFHQYLSSDNAMRRIIGANEFLYLPDLSSDELSAALDAMLTGLGFLADKWNENSKQGKFRFLGKELTNEDYAQMLAEIIGGLGKVAKEGGYAQPESHQVRYPNLQVEACKKLAMEDVQRITEWWSAHKRSVVNAVIANRSGSHSKP